MAQNINYGRDQFIGVGGNVQINNNFVARTGRLWDEVAGVGASHLSKQQFDRGLECLEGTRVAIIDAILNWLASKDSSSPLCWLSGAAGVGKSAIAMTVAKSCEGKGLASSFFFFRPDPNRNDLSAFALCIAHDLAVRMPFARGYINERISNDPTILKARMEDQFQELIFKPCLHRRLLRDLLSMLRLIRKEPTLVIIDGLDECGDKNTQRILSTIISSYKQSCHFPLRFLICSRPEAWIWEAFDKEELCGLTQRYQLDDEVFPNKDIERYYRHEFEKIRNSTQFARRAFPEVWPSPEDLEHLVGKSSGQFVYATTLVRIMNSHGCNPLAQLSSILNYTLANPSKSFAPIDLLYHMILFDHPSPEQLVSVLAAIFILPPHASPLPELIELLLGLPIGEIDTILWPMHSVLKIGGAGVPIVVYHASFMDFLYDKSRSERFHIDASVHCELLARRWIQLLEPRNQPSFPNNQTKCTLWDGWADFCLCVEQPSEELLHDLQKMDLPAVSINVALIHQHHTKLSSITHPLEAIISWLAPMDGSLPTETIYHFKEFLGQFESALMIESEESTPTELRETLNCVLYALCHIASMALLHSGHYEKLHPILTAILVLPSELNLSPEWIGLLFDMPRKDVTLALQGMHSVLDIHGWKDKIQFHHPLFAKYFGDHIIIPTGRNTIARQWLHSVSATKTQTYSSEQLYGKNTNSFFTEWMEFCTQFEPTRDLIDGLHDIDFASVFFCKSFSAYRGSNSCKSWSQTFEALCGWILQANHGNDSTHPEQDLMNKLKQLPKSFHLEQLLGPLPDHDLVIAVLITTEACKDTYRRTQSRLESDARENYQHQAPLRITECHCNVESTGNKLDDTAKHLAYQEACTQVVGAYVTEFDVLAKSDPALWSLSSIFQRLVNLLILQHCGLNAELLSHCKVFFGSAHGLETGFSADKIRGMKAKLYDWIEVCTMFLIHLPHIVNLVGASPLDMGFFFSTKTFPESFAEEAMAIKAQVDNLPWNKWAYV
ncbi:hypothetical protein PQX77_002582 [Marasmius sp. AFHP31]|nr:hypothetical protein PQX77_002582 [Marasmius sp. AFHP31]